MLKKQATYWLVLLLVLPVAVSGDSNTITLSPADNYVAYPGQTVQHHVDVTYSGESGTALKLDLQSQYLSSVTEMAKNWSSMMEKQNDSFGP